MVLQKLIKLVSSGDTILHGSPNYFNEIIPRLTDGEMAICASVVPEITLYHALLKGSPGRKIGGGAWSFNKKRFERATITFRLTEERLNFLLSKPKLTGYVYPMDTYDFDRRGLAECRLYKSRFLRTKILVTEDDLPFCPIPNQLEYKIELPYRFKNHFAIKPGYYN